MDVTFAKELAQKALSTVKPILFQVKKHSPEILTATGAVSVVAGTALACKATLEARDILDEPVEVMGVARMEGDVVKVVDEEATRKNAVMRGFKVVRGYLPGVGLVGGGIAMMVAAKSIEHGRFTAALGAYSSLQATFDEYRARVADKHGAEAELAIYNGAETLKVEYEELGEGGKKPKKVKEEIALFTAGENPLHRIFDEYNSPTEWRENLDVNRHFLECQQAAMNMELKANGRLFLNDVYKRLGFEYCEAGQFIGWLADDIEGCGDGYVDFGIDYAAIKDEIEIAQQENRRPEPSLWLTFNCDGQIWDKPLNKKYDI